MVRRIITPAKRPALPLPNQPIFPDEALSLLQPMIDIGAHRTKFRLKEMTRFDAQAWQQALSIAVKKEVKRVIFVPINDGLVEKPDWATDEMHALVVENYGWHWPEEPDDFLYELCALAEVCVTDERVGDRQSSRLAKEAAELPDGYDFFRDVWVRGLIDPDEYAFYLDSAESGVVGHCILPVVTPYLLAACSGNTRIMRELEGVIRLMPAGVPLGEKRDEPGTWLVLSGRWHEVPLTEPLSVDGHLAVLAETDQGMGEPICMIIPVSKEASQFGFNHAFWVDDDGRCVIAETGLWRLCGRKNPLPIMTTLGAGEKHHGTYGRGYQLSYAWFTFIPLERSDELGAMIKGWQEEHGAELIDRG